MTTAQIKAARRRALQDPRYKKQKEKKLADKLRAKQMKKGRK